ncbi:predicted protein [Lichtheimia corymbifera JMRC:FSU:9682]|uniref:REM-1 domain-containing protein n=1 Tax=Lichtheimia corymbifera JMRC:FSU:9682 TaxID=1263082 RepID=A0A068SHU7_9FUNG|nr:predicted protein [Lichtheimia corymbifera JMRC:FSU:9682]
MSRANLPTNSNSNSNNGQTPVVVDQGCSGSGSGSGSPAPPSPSPSQAGSQDSRSSRQRAHDSIQVLRRELSQVMAQRVEAVTSNDETALISTRNRLEILKQEIEAMQDLAQLVAPARPATSSSSSSNSRIPPGLPYMQWS